MKKKAAQVKHHHSRVRRRTKKSKKSNPLQVSFSFKTGCYYDAQKNIIWPSQLQPMIPN